MVPEATIILEYLAVNYPGPTPLIPSDPRAAIETRLMDRIFDNYVLTPQSSIVFNAYPARGPGRRFRRDPVAGAAGQGLRLAGRSGGGPDVGGGRRLQPGRLRRGAGAPLRRRSTHPIPTSLARLHAYRARLLAWPSYARALDEARPYRHLFPLGAPEGRD